MRTKEFIKRVEELGFEFREVQTNIHIIADCNLIASVSKIHPYWVDTFPEVNVERIKRKELFELIFEYGRTPVEDREEEKKFYLRHRYLKCSNGDDAYFYILANDIQGLGRRIKSILFKFEFTLKEIEEIKKKFDTDLSDFELVDEEE